MGVWRFDRSWRELRNIMPTLGRNWTWDFAMALRWIHFASVKTDSGFRKRHQDTYIHLARQPGLLFTLHHDIRVNGSSLLTNHPIVGLHSTLIAGASSFVYFHFACIAALSVTLCPEPRIAPGRFPATVTNTLLWARRQSKCVAFLALLDLLGTWDATSREPAFFEDHQFSASILSGHCFELPLVDSECLFVSCATSASVWQLGQRNPCSYVRTVTSRNSK